MRNFKENIDIWEQTGKKKITIKWPCFFFFFENKNVLNALF